LADTNPAQMPKDFLPWRVFPFYGRNAVSGLCSGWDAGESLMPGKLPSRVFPDPIAGAQPKRKKVSQHVPVTAADAGLLFMTASGPATRGKFVSADRCD